MKRAFAILSTIFFTSVSYAEEKAGEKAGEKMSMKEMMEKVRTTLNASGPSIDQCTSRYTSEYPKAKGEVRVSATVTKDGKVSKVALATTLEGARNLRYCLEQVAKIWALPGLYSESEPMSLTIPVEPGVKFKIYGPDEKRPAKAAEKKSGFLKFIPQNFGRAK